MIAGLKRAEINEIRKNLRRWYTRPVGQLLLQMERDELDEILPTLFGYHIVQAGCLLGDDLMSGSRISNRVLLDPDKDGETLQPTLYAYPDALPVATDSVDVVLLPHTLEFERDPHQVLREADRVLIPEGHVVVLGFNPWSLWGLRRLLRRRKRHNPPWAGDFLSITRIKDWLALLGFDIVLVHRYFYRPPINRKGILNRLGFIEGLGRRLWPYFSGAYVLVAKKRVATLTPVKQRWRPRPKLVGDLAGPTTRSAQKKCQKG